jgi:hypothetical protein
MKGHIWHILRSLDFIQMAAQEVFIRAECDLFCFRKITLATVERLFQAREWYEDVTATVRMGTITETLELGTKEDSKI